MFHDTMSPQELSLFEMGRQDIIDICIYTIDSIFQYRKDDYERKIRVLMERSENSAVRVKINKMFGWIPWYKEKLPLTYEQADKILREPPEFGFSEHTWSFVSDEPRVKIAKSLLKAARNTVSDTIQVTAYDYNWLKIPPKE